MGIFKTLLLAAVAGWIAERLSGSNHAIWTNIFYGLLGLFVATTLLPTGGFWWMLLTSSAGAVIAVFAIRHATRS